MEVRQLRCRLFLGGLWLLFESQSLRAKMVSMKIVEEPSNYGLNAPDHSNTETQIHMRIKPSNFSGPPHLKTLHGKCFTKIEADYRYALCPFSNVTQHEQSLRWNPYSGVLGVWQEWEIENNTFIAMMMREGDTCGDIHRTMRVLLKCGDKTEIGQVSEPETCHYQMTLQTPLVCHPHSRLVYPTLSEPLRQEWDKLEGRYLNEELTEKGYRKRLHKIFEKAGYMLPESQREIIAKQAIKQETEVVKKDNGDFDSLYECKTEYQSLKTEIEGLRALLEVNGISPDTHNKKADGKKNEEYPERRYPNVNNEEEYPDINNILIKDSEEADNMLYH